MGLFWAFKISLSHPDSINVHTTLSTVLYLPSQLCSNHKDSFWPKQTAAAMKAAEVTEGFLGITLEPVSGDGFM